MSDAIKHECGVALIRLRKPLEYYYEKYGTGLYGLHKLYLLMQKQHNRGQDGAGIATIKLDTAPGYRYISRKRSNSSQPLRDLFDDVYKRFQDLTAEELRDTNALKEKHAFIGEVLLGHLRYGTHGSNTIETCHPFIRQNNWKTRNLILAGNFNLTNVEDLFAHLVALGQHPKEKADTVTVMERIGHFLDREVQHLFEKYKYEGFRNQEITEQIAENLDVLRILQRASKRFDGGYTMVGMLGHGDAFVMRDPHGIRPAFYYENEEVMVVASERPAIQTAFNVLYKDVRELKPGHALIIKKNGSYSEQPFIEPKPITPCSFERIYFSRGTDRDIYQERQNLGYFLAKKIMGRINNDVENTVFAYVPNTAETAFIGMTKGIHDVLNEIKKEKILQHDKITKEELDKILNLQPRIEKIIVKDVKLRTFISEDNSRKELVAHVYDVTYGIIRDHQDTIVLLDDSIVRGTTLRESIIRMVNRLKPKKIIIVSSSPQIRFPDCYGIDMSKMKDFVAFNALVVLLKEHKKDDVLKQAYKEALLQMEVPREQCVNVVTKLYKEFDVETISKKIAQLVTPDDIQIEVEVVFLSIEDLHRACPNHHGDWYFTGNYPTPGGNRVANKAFINYMEGKDERAY